MLKPILVSALALLVLVQPALARSQRRVHHHGHRVHRHWEPYRHATRYHHSRFPANGVPITAGSDAIRINAVGEVISSPTPLIQKERNFLARARKDLDKQRASRPGAPTQP